MGVGEVGVGEVGVGEVTHNFGKECTSKRMRTLR